MQSDNLQFLFIWRKLGRPKVNFGPMQRRQLLSTIYVDHSLLSLYIRSKSLNGNRESLNNFNQAFLDNHLLNIWSICFRHFFSHTSKRKTIMTTFDKFLGTSFKSKKALNMMNICIWTSANSLNQFLAPPLPSLIIPKN